MTVGSDTLTFFYDASGNPLSLIHNGTTYYYATNLQGDVVALLNASGTAVVTYTYDAWGKLLSTGGTMATTLGVRNPLRYRGYVYDAETGLYYLQSRYYDPEVGRFINADAFASTGIGLIGNNMFAYCNNNPVVNYDSTGAVPISFYDGRDVNPLYIGHLGMGGGGAGGYQRGGGSGGSGYKDIFEEISDKSSKAWDAVDEWNRKQQEAELQEAQMLFEGATRIYDTLENNDYINITAGQAGYNAYKAAHEFKKCTIYFLLPIPTPVDEAFAIGHFLKGVYHAGQGVKAVIKWTQEN